MARELAALVLGGEAGLLDDAEVDPEGPWRHAKGPALVALVDPSPGDWEAALALEAPIVLVTARPLDPRSAVAAVLRGADAIVHADSHPEQLREAARLLLLGGAVLDPHQAKALAVAARGSGMSGTRQITLTGRERQILASIERGELLKQTATALGISAKTVESLQGRLFCKLGVRNRAEAVVRAHDLGLCDGSRGRRSGAR